MSAFSIGADTPTVKPDGTVTGKQGGKGKGKGKAKVKPSNFPETIVKWIPGEAITFYAAIIGVGAAQSALTGKESAEEILERIQAGSVWWFLAGAAIAVALVIVGSFATQSKPKGERPSARGLFVRSFLTLVAFALWTSALPGSWSYSLHFVRDMGAAWAILLVPLSLLFAGIAEKLTRVTTT